MCEAIAYEGGTARRCSRPAENRTEYCQVHEDAKFRALGSRGAFHFELDAARLYVSARLGENADDERLKTAERALAATPEVLKRGDLLAFLNKASADRGFVDFKGAESSLKDVHVPTLLAAKARSLGYMTPAQLKEIRSKKTAGEAAAALLRFQKEAEDAVVEALYLRYLPPEGERGESTDRA